MQMQSATNLALQESKTSQMQTGYSSGLSNLVLSDAGEVGVRKGLSFSSTNNYTKQ